jgi:hypothetical protein
MPVLKITFGEDTRRISLDRAPSFEELRQIVKQLFNIPHSTFVLKYEDEEKDQITIASDSELNEAIAVASKHFSNILRLFVLDKSQAKTTTETPQMVPNDVFRNIFAQAVTGSNLDISSLLSTFQNIGNNLDKAPQTSQQQSLQMLNQLLTTFPWLNETIATVVKQGFQATTNNNPSSVPASNNYTTVSSVAASNNAPTNNRVNSTASPSKKHRYMAKFIKDVSVVDGTALAPETKFVKTWRVRNDGATAWPDNTTLNYVGGDQLGTSSVVPVPAVEAGQEVEISVSMLAPSLPGRYNSFWRLCGPDGNKFGHRMWADITVKPSLGVAHQADVPVAQSVPVVQNVPALVDEQPQAQEPSILPEVAEEKSESCSANDNTNDAEKSTTPAEKSTTPAEADALVTLVDMGFKGDLLSLLRRHGGDLMNTLGELITRNT